MSVPTSPDPSLLLLSVLYRADSDDGALPCWTELEQLLQNQFGPIRYRSPCMNFKQTQYYEPEMGSPLARHFLAFQELVSRERLADIKLLTNEMERRFLNNKENRRINLDPGLLSLENLTLATGKNFTHRIYLHSGIFAEVTLYYQKGYFQLLPWTYPDYGSETVLEILTMLREQLRETLFPKK